MLRNLRGKFSISIMIFLACIFAFAGFSAAARNFSKTVRYQVEKEYPPFKFMNGQYLSGFDIELGDLVFKDKEYRVDYSMDSWEKVYARLKVGTIDTCGLLAVLDERKKEILYSKPVMETCFALFQRNSSEKIAIGNLKEYTVGVGLGQYSETILKKELGIEKYKTYPTIIEAIRALDNGEIDALFENQEVVNYFLIEKGLKGDIVPSVTNLYPTEFAFGVRKDAPELVDYINQRLAKLQKTGLYEELYQKYFYKHTEHYYNIQKEKVTITIIGILIGLLAIFVLLQFYIRSLRKKVSYAHQELLRQHEWLSVTLASIEDAVIATDEKSRVNYINPIAQKYLKLSEKEALGQFAEKILGLLTEDTREPFQLPVKMILSEAGEKEFHHQAILISKTEEFLIDISVTAIYNAMKEVRGTVITFQDITKRKLAENSLKRERDFSSSIINHAGIIILIWETDGTIIKFNSYGEQISGFSEEMLLGKKWKGIAQPKGFEENLEAFFEEARKNNLRQSFEWVHIRSDGTEHRMLWNNSLLKNEDGEACIVVSMGIDITERREAERKLTISYEELEAANEQLAATEEELREKYDQLRQSQEALEQSEELYRLAVDGSNDALWDLDLTTDKLFISPKGKEMLGYKENEITTGESWINLIHPDDLEKYTQSMNYYFAGKTSQCKLEYRVRKKNGEYVWILGKGKAIWDEAGKPVRMAGSHTDISDRKKTEEEIHKLAYYDTLTGLPNRILLMDRISQALAQSRRSKKKVALLYLDLDNFKAINDTQGHNFGDELIKLVAVKMKEMIREYDTVSRLGGDEFVVLQPQVKHNEDISLFADRILNLFNTPWYIKGREFYVTASIGIAVYPEDGKDGQALLKSADAAMYKAKAQGKNNFKLYMKSMHDDILEKLELERNIRYALERKEFAVFYQPQVDLSSGRITGVEALVRWIHPVQGIVPPLKFIPLAEETGLILPIGEWVLRTACMQAKSWQDGGMPPVSLAVNLSARQFQQQNLVEAVQSALEDSGLEPKWLELEITESIALYDLDNAIHTILRLREMGIRISLDDFGTGFSSLNYLKRLPINNLKIDKAFVQGITDHENEEAIANAIITLSHSMNLDVTAEGVETEEQLAFLKQHHCDKVQGYLFSKPIPSEKLEALLKEERKFC